MKVSNNGQGQQVGTHDISEQSLAENFKMRPHALTRPTDSNT